MSVKYHTRGDETRDHVYTKAYRAHKTNPHSGPVWPISIVACSLNTPPPHYQTCEANKGHDPTCHYNASCLIRSHVDSSKSRCERVDHVYSFSSVNVNVSWAMLRGLNNIISINRVIDHSLCATILHLASKRVLFKRENMHNALIAFLVEVN